jgi:hypothetical protein
MKYSTTETIQALETQTSKVKLTIEVPLGMAEFFNDLGNIRSGVQSETLKEFAESSILMQFQSFLDELPWTMFNMEQIYRVYGLREFERKKENLQQAST